MRKTTIACETSRARSTSAVAGQFNSVHQVAAVGDSYPNICKDDDKSEQSDRVSPEIFIKEKTKLDGLEKHRCIKCDKVGKMLVCAEIGCPVAIHEDCLIPKAYFDDLGNFYCPYCSYKRAVDKVQRLKKKAIAAKEVLSKFLKEPVVDSFGGEGLDNEKKEKAATGPPHSEDKNQHADEIQPDQHVDENVADATEKCDLEAKENEEAQQVRNMEQTTVRKEHKKKAAGESTKGDPFEFTAGENLENKSGEAHNEIVSEGSEDAEQNDTAPKPSTRVRKNPSHVKKMMNVFRLQEKRKRLMWTEKEEEMLMGGVKLYSKNPKKKNLPWKKILELGSGVFHNTRSPADLQNKWKNMTRKEK